jgi:peptidoglycan/LPS O-acetylase OafA/YrhL
MAIPKAGGFSFIPKEKILSEEVTRDRHNNFSTIRIILASLVICSHSFELVDGNRSREILTRLFGTISFGVFAVDGFFLVSGYLITQSYLQSRNLDYLLKRVLRIYPAYIVAFIISIGLGEFSIDGSGGLNAKLALHNLFNLLFLLSPIMKNPYPGSFYAGLNVSMWTISYEFHCYIIPDFPDEIVFPCTPVPNQS